MKIKRALDIILDSLGYNTDVFEEGENLCGIYRTSLPESRSEYREYYGDGDYDEEDDDYDDYNDCTEYDEMYAEECRRAVNMITKGLRSFADMIEGVEAWQGDKNYIEVTVRLKK